MRHVSTFLSSPLPFAHKFERVVHRIFEWQGRRNPHEQCVDWKVASALPVLFPSCASHPPIIALAFFSGAPYSFVSSSVLLFFLRPFHPHIRYNVTIRLTLARIGGFCGAELCGF